MRRYVKYGMSAHFLHFEFYVSEILFILFPGIWLYFKELGYIV